MLKNDARIIGGGLMPQYLYWRGRSIWCRYPVPGKPPSYPLGIKRVKNTKTEIARCWEKAERLLAEFRVAKEHDLSLFEKKVEAKPEPAPLLPITTIPMVLDKFWNEYFYEKKSAPQAEATYRYLKKKWESQDASQFNDKDLGDWVKEMKIKGNVVLIEEEKDKKEEDKKAKPLAVNTINNRVQFLQQAFRYNKIPFPDWKNLPNGNIRGFYLNKFLFERNYLFLANHKDPGSKQYSKYYLALWETIRRPKEVAQYLISDVDQYRKCIQVRAEISKTGKTDLVAISDRLWEIIEPELSRGSGELLFPNLKGGPWIKGRCINYQKHVEKLTEKFGESGGWCRDCRRGSASYRVDELEVAASDVKDQAGWRTWSSFDRYHIGTLASKRRAANDPNQFRTNFVQMEKTA